MAEKKQVFEDKVMTFSPLYIALGNAPVPDSDERGIIGRRQQKENMLNPKMEETVRRLIAHLKDEE